MNTVSVKERPIICRAPMVRAILEGHQTKMIKVVKNPELFSLLSYKWDALPNARRYLVQAAAPYGRPGDRLWVQEEWQTYCDMDHIRPRSLPVGCVVQYPATYDGCVSKCRPSIQMPRWASRITLKITDVCAQQLHDIDKLDIKAAGFGSIFDLEARWNDQHCYGPYWQANPWVWVYAFRRIIEAES